jgi:intracellular multiplication protein IcmL
MSAAAEDANQDLLEMARKLHRTSDAIEPAVRQEKARLHQQWLAGSSIKLNFVLSSALLISLVCNGVFGWFAIHREREYFAADNGRIFPLVPMSQPYRRAADVIQYAKDTINRSFTIDFLNWRQQLEDTRGRYTTKGFQSFIQSLQSSGVLATVREKRMNMSVAATTGVLTREGVEHGTYVWYVEMPIDVKLAGQSSEQSPQKLLATVRIERIPTLDSIEGIGVAQLVTRPQ